MCVFFHLGTLLDSTFDLEGQYRDIISIDIRLTVEIVTLQVETRLHVTEEAP